MRYIYSALSDTTFDGWVQVLSTQSIRENSYLSIFHSVVLAAIDDFFFLFCHFIAANSLHPRAHMLSHVTPCTAARQAPLSMDFSRQEYWSGLLLLMIVI